MKAAIKKVTRFLAAEDGPTAVEYAMAMLLIFLATLSAIILLGQSTSGSFGRSSQSIQAVTEGE